jgi:hypothetical protein
MDFSGGTLEQRAKIKDQKSKVKNQNSNEEAPLFKL